MSVASLVGSTDAATAPSPRRVTQCRERGRFCRLEGEECFAYCIADVMSGCRSFSSARNAEAKEKDGAVAELFLQKNYSFSLV